MKIILLLTLTVCFGAVFGQTCKCPPDSNKESAFIDNKKVEVNHDYLLCTKAEEKIGKSGVFYSVQNFVIRFCKGNELVKFESIIRYMSRIIY